MIKADNLTRKYGEVVAVDNVSFEIDKGEVVGLLGPNGAGKTTILKMLTGYLAPSQGKAIAGDADIEKFPSECKARIGYLAENNPIYEDMAVYQYLMWAGKTRGIKGKKLKEAVKDAVAKCALEDVVGKNISELSRGYRQRVGVANAILHNPDMLFLDEPTSGLDPNQAGQVRELINGLKKEKTIVLSTHILSEAKYICDRLIIIHKGKIAAQGTLAQIEAGMKRGNSFILRVENPADAPAIKAELEKFGAADFSQDGKDAVFQITSDGRDIRRDLFSFAVQKNLPVVELKKEETKLEDMFRELTYDKQN